MQIKLRYDNIPLNGIIVCIMGHVTSDMLGIERLSSLFFYGIYGMLVWCLIQTLSENKIRKRHDPFLLTIAIVFIALLNVLAGAQYISFDYLKKMIMFCGTLLMLALSTKYTPDDSIEKWYSICLQVIIATVFYKTFLSPELYGTTEFHCMGLNNSNVAGMWVLVLFGGCLRGLKSRKILIKVFFAAEAAILVYCCQLTNCRSALLSMLALLILWILLLKAKNLDNIVNAASLFIPMVFPFVYLYLYQVGFEVMLDGEKTFFSGRQETWTIALQALSRSPISGAYGEILKTGSFQMHNIFVEVLSSYGVVVAGMVWGLLIWVMSLQRARIRTSIQRGLLFSFSVILLQGTFEAALFSGGAGIGLWSCLFLFLMNIELDQ